MRPTLALCSALLLVAAGASVKAQNGAGLNAPAPTERPPAGEDSRTRLPPPPPPPPPPPAARTKDLDAAPLAPVESGGRGVDEKPAPTPAATSQTTPHPKRAAPATPRDPGTQDPTAGTAGHDGAADDDAPARDKFHWAAAVEQSMLFLGVQHAYAMTQPKTRRDLRGPFLKDYFASVRSLHGWGDGGRFFTNYVAHPLQGSLLGFVQIQNDPAGARRRFGKSGGYWRSRAKALAWSAAWSTQFEIGPVSQASIGNVGLHGKQTYVDLITTPVGGLGLLVLEDAADRYVIARIERATRSRLLKITLRTLINPTRSVANLLRFKTPWHRDAALR